MSNYERAVEKWRCQCKKARVNVFKPLLPIESLNQTTYSLRQDFSQAFN